MVRCRPGLDCRGQGRAIGVAVQGVEQPEALAGVGLDIDQAHLLPGLGFLAAVGHVLRQANLAGTQEQQLPALPRLGAAGARAALLALAVGQHVRDLSRFPGVDLGQLVHDQECVVVQRSQRLDAVGRRAPAIDVVGCAKQRGSRCQCGGLAGRRVALEVDAARLQPREFKQHGAKARAQGEHAARVARAQRCDLIAPALSRARHRIGSRHGLSLEPHDFLGLADGLVRQHKHRAVRAVVPARLVDPARPQVRLGLSQVAGQGVAHAESR